MLLIFFFFFEVIMQFWKRKEKGVVQMCFSYNNKRGGMDMKVETICGR
jgi:hypothetical protein